MQAYERLLNYVTFDTGSDESCPDCPSTKKQLVLAEALVKEMQEMGISDARMDEHGYVYGSVPANAEGMPAIGLIAHMDVSSAVATHPVRPSIIRNYDGKNITLANGDTLDVSVFPDVAKTKGKDLIVTDGNTLLGADDKAGIAEILTACEMILADPAKKHGKICIGFTPDEEIGRGADLFDVSGFGADFAYTVDGGAVGAIEFENFNAAAGTVVIHGRSVHPGTAKNRMLNACLVGMEFNAMLPAAETPAHTEGYEGFYHLCGMEGQEETARLVYIIRDHDMKQFELRKRTFSNIGRYLNGKYGENTVEVTVTDSYYNMRQEIEPRMDIIHRAEDAYRKAGVEPFYEAIRGGTDGARLTYMGLLCPNLATGGMNFHGRFECIAVQDMDIMAETIMHLVSE